MRKRLQTVLFHAALCEPSNRSLVLFPPLLSSIEVQVSSLLVEPRPWVGIRLALQKGMDILKDDHNVLQTMQISLAHASQAQGRAVGPAGSRRIPSHRHQGAHLAVSHAHRQVRKSILVDLRMEHFGLELRARERLRKVGWKCQGQVVDAVLVPAAF